jgi:glucosamine-6-phosphate deaminase
MRVIIEKNYDEMSKWVANYIVQKINLFNPSTKQPFVLGLPTGQTPIGVYNELIALYKAGKVDFKNVITFNMDEYVGLSKDNIQSYHYFMKNNLFNHINIPENNINLLDGCASNLDNECKEYEAKIKKAGIDLFLAGIGSDGHIAFNEPYSSLSSSTRIKTLNKETIASNSRFFNNQNEVPTTALTVGVNTITSSKEVLLIASGISKAVAIQQCIEGAVNHLCTASMLQLHKKALIVCDRDSANELKLKTLDYFENLQKNTDIFGNTKKPDIDKFISSSDKILIFSPHPDDDVIGLGGTMQKFNTNNVKVVYMSPGTGGYDKTVYDHNPRFNEALLSLKTLGYNKNNIEFMKLPFYTNKVPISENDYHKVTELVTKFKPDHIFVCDDIDPNKTHLKCYEIIKNSLHNIQLDPLIWLYKSAWGNWDEDIPNCISYLGEILYNNKKISIKMHDSQDPPLVNYGDNMAFYDKIVDNNTCDQYYGQYIEKFEVINKQEFLHR